MELGKEQGRGLCAAAGVYFGPEAGIRDAFLERLSGGVFDGFALLHQLGAAVPAGIVCALARVAAYYSYIRRRMDSHSVRVTERLRNRIGLAGRRERNRFPKQRRYQ